ncbi:hypothetical protein [uncultured Ferrimonas sp.]|uniref:hypothetical protein n=1 Tax=uncultured Ferrimonas sp. TaxID=432640 RepID=UPI00260BBDCD|nr:hypothetical protein [uncultured Ferrimonas sp.]
MSQFIYSLRSSKQEKLLFSLFLLAFIVFGAMVFELFFLTAVEHAWVEQLWQRGGAEPITLGVAGSVSLGYLFYLLARAGQRLRQQHLAEQQLMQVHRHLSHSLCKLLLTQPQLQQLPQAAISSDKLFQQMVENIEEAPYQENRLQPSSSAGEATLQLRLDLVNQFTLHVVIMKGVLGQVQQLQRLCGDVQPQLAQQCRELGKLLAAFDEELYLNTQQEKWAKLFNAYQPLCYYLGQHHRT